MKTRNILLSLFLSFLLCGSGVALLISSAYGLGSKRELQMKNSDIKNSSEGSWHVVETWTVGLTTIVLFSTADLLQPLHDVFEKLDDGSDDLCSERSKLGNIRAIHKMIVRISKRSKRIRRILKKLLGIHELDSMRGRYSS